jgi:hypothetical protein
MSNTVKIVGILDFADNTFWNFKNMLNNLIKKCKIKNKYYDIENRTTTRFLILYYTLNISYYTKCVVLYIIFGPIKYFL